jgi:hypothetical protein
MNPILLKMQREGLLDEQAAQGVDALVAQGKPLDEALLSSSGLPEDRLLRYLSEEFHIPCVDLDVVHPDRAFLSQFPARILLAHRLLPVSQTSRPAHRPWAWPRPWAKSIDTNRKPQAPNALEMAVRFMNRLLGAMASAIGRHLRPGRLAILDAPQRERF